MAQAACARCCNRPLELARRETELITDEKLPYVPRWINVDTIDERFGSRTIKRKAARAPRNGSETREYKNSRIRFDEYLQVRNDYYCHIRKAKRLARQAFFESVFPTDELSQLACDRERCWKALKYTKPRRLLSRSVAQTDDWTGSWLQPKRKQGSSWHKRFQYRPESAENPRYQTRC
jgi:hypothetical protein